MARAFGQAIQVWRAGGSRSLACPACGTGHALDDLAFKPDAAFATGAVVFADTEGHSLTEKAARGLRAVLGPFRLVLRRVR